MEKFRTSDEVRLAYQDEGSGPSFLFLHGWTMSSAFFRRQVEGLRRDHRVVALDLRGCGQSAAKPGTHTMDRLARDVHELLVHLDLERVVLVGWSMGGGITMRYLDLFSMERLAGVVLIDFPPKFHEEPSVADKVCESLRTRRERFITSFLKRMVLAEPSAEDLAWMVREHLQSSADTGCEMYRQMGTASALGSRYDLPALLVFPHQGWFHESLETWRGIFPRHEAPAFAQSRHAPFWEEPDRFNEVLRVFATSLD